MDDRGRIGLSREVIECGKAATNVGDAEESPMDGVEYFCLGIYLVLRLGVRRASLASRRRRWARDRLHFEVQNESRRGRVAEAQANTAFIRISLDYLQLPTDNPIWA